MGSWFKIVCAVEVELLNTAKMTDSWQKGFEFGFVMQDPNESFSRETQTAIRKQAMRAIGATRRKPRRRSNPNPTRLSKCQIQRDSDLAHPLPPMPLSGLEMLVRDREIDPVDLSALTSIHIGTMLAGAHPLAC